MGAVSILGIAVAGISTIASAWQQVAAGVLQKEHGINGVQLLHQCAPSATALMAVLVPIIDKVGLGAAAEDTLLGYPYNPMSAITIVGSGLVGLAVTLSAFQAIGLSSPLTYNVVGHSKTVVIITGGWLLFEDIMTARKAAGVVLTMAAVALYSYAKFAEARPPAVNNTTLRN
jgi:solute carrier family 35 protein E3